MTYYLDPVPELALRIVRAAFPDYRGRKYKLETHDAPIHVNSSWGGGSRDYFAFVRLSDLAVLPVPTNGNPFVGTLPEVEIPEGVVCVEHSIFCGKDLGITFHIRSDAAPLLPPADVPLTWADKVVLYAASAWKASYAGRSRREYATHYTGISADDYDSARADLIERKLLNAAGAITPLGRNALGGCGNVTEYNLKREKGASG